MLKQFNRNCCNMQTHRSQLLTAVGVLAVWHLAKVSSSSVSAFESSSPRYRNSLGIFTSKMDNHRAKRESSSQNATDKYCQPDVSVLPEDEKEIIIFTQMIMILYVYPKSNFRSIKATVNMEKYAQTKEFYTVDLCIIPNKWNKLEFEVYKDKNLVWEWALRIRGPCTREWVTDYSTFQKYWNVRVVSVGESLWRKYSPPDPNCPSGDSSIHRTPKGPKESGKRSPSDEHSTVRNGTDASHGSTVIIAIVVSVVVLIITVAVITTLLIKWRRSKIIPASWVSGFVPLRSDITQATLPRTRMPTPPREMCKFVNCHFPFCRHQDPPLLPGDISREPSYAEVDDLERRRREREPSYVEVEDSGETNLRREPSYLEVDNLSEQEPSQKSVKNSGETRGDREKSYLEPVELKNTNNDMKKSAHHESKELRIPSKANQISLSFLENNPDSAVKSTNSESEEEHQTDEHPRGRPDDNTQYTEEDHLRSNSTKTSKPTVVNDDMTPGDALDDNGCRRVSNDDTLSKVDPADGILSNQQYEDMRSEENKREADSYQDERNPGSGNSSDKEFMEKNVQLEKDIYETLKFIDARIASMTQDLE